jgi:tRNA/tmRNA/rRNA uracil-C5-methylase (TrmA/RlmC/RlmD family)
MPIYFPEEELKWNYRGKVCLNTRYHNQQWEFGMLKRDDFIDIPSCPVHTLRVLRTIDLLKKVLPPVGQFPMAFYYHAHAQVTLILKTKIFPGSSWLTEGVKKQLEEFGIEGLSIHLHPSAGRRLFDKFGWHQVFGRNFSFDSQNLIYGNTSFHQLISSLYLQSLDLAETFFRSTMPMPVVDLYCGRGVSLTRWVQNNLQSIGIETSGEAVACARINAPRATVLQGTCERRLPQLEAWRRKKAEEGCSSLLLYTNPPRTGMEPLVTDWIVNNLKPEKIAYLSCSAGTLKRDLLKLTQKGLEVVSITPFDFFPQTYHVECLVLLKRNHIV